MTVAVARPIANDWEIGPAASKSTVDPTAASMTHRVAPLVAAVMVTSPAGVVVQPPLPAPSAKVMVPVLFVVA